MGILQQRVVRDTTKKNAAEFIDSSKNVEPRLEKENEKGFESFEQVETDEQRQAKKWDTVFAIREGSKELRK